MIRRVLVAVEDAAPALAALRFSIELVQAVGAELGVVTVAADERAAAPILRHATALATAAGVAPATTRVRGGPAYEGILAEARAWDADVVVVGRSARRPSGRAYVGSQTEHVLEFSEIPVVVVPARTRRH